MKISINKDSQVPIRDQLIEQIALQIASGTLKGKEKLPSIRALAQRLGIHYSTVTAAYNHLSDVGLLEVRQGSGVRVANPHSAIEVQNNTQSLEEMFKDFLARASERGFSRSEVQKQVSNLVEARPVKRIVAIDRNKDFHKLLEFELKPHFKLPIEPITTEDYMKTKEKWNDALIVTSLYHIFAFKDFVPDPTRLVVCNIEPGREELTAAAELPSGHLVVLVSGSQTLLTMATKMLASARGDDLAVRTVVTDDKTELQYIMKYANLVICDSYSESAVRPIVGNKKLAVFKLYSPSTIKAIQDRLTKWG